MTAKKPKRGPDGHYPLVNVLANDATAVLGEPVQRMHRELERSLHVAAADALRRSTGLPEDVRKGMVRAAISDQLAPFFQGHAGELMRQGLDKRVDARKTRNDKAASEDEKRQIASLFDQLYDRELLIAPDRRPKVTVLYADVMAQHVPQRGLTIIKQAVATYSARRVPP